MGTQRFQPSLNKTFLAAREGYDFYAVNAFAVRNTAQPDEEFGTFATRDEFPDLVPDGEVWISSRTAREADFFIANALARLKAMTDGEGKETAYTVGLNAERKVRRHQTGIEYRAGRPHRRIPGAVYVRPYLTMPDRRGPVRVWLVNGAVVRSTYKTDYVEGGHGYVYRWVPKDEIWVERDLDPAEMPFILAHEYVERRLMRDDGVDYERAHRTASEMEFDLRKAETRAEFPGLTRRKFLKGDVKAVATREFLEYVRQHYPRGPVARAGRFLAGIAAKVLP